MEYPLSDIQEIVEQIDTRWLRERRGFITGASGWFGSWFCRVLEYIGAPCIKLWHTDTENIDNFRIPEQKIDYIIHLSPGRVDRVIECADKHKADVLFTSSGAVYAEDLDEYGQMKSDNEWELINSDVNVKIARCFTVAGAGVPLFGQYALGGFIGHAIEGKDIRIWGDGSTVRTYLYMTDVISWLFKILIQGETNKAYDVGGEEEITFWELARMVREYFPKRDIIIENKQFNERFPYYVPDLTYSYGLGCRVRVTLAESVERTVQYYRRIYEL